MSTTPTAKLTTAPNPRYKNRAIRIRAHHESAAGRLIDELLAAGIMPGATALGTVGVSDATSGISTDERRITLDQATRLASYRFEVARICQAYRETGIWPHHAITSHRARKTLWATWLALQAILAISKSPSALVSSSQLAELCGVSPRAMRRAVSGLIAAEILRSHAGGGGVDGPRGGYELARQPSEIALIEVVALFGPTARALVEGLTGLDIDLLRWPLTRVPADALSEVKAFFMTTHGDRVSDIAELPSDLT